MAKKTKKASKTAARQRAQKSGRMKRLVRERADLAVAVYRLSEAALFAGVDLWEGERTAEAVAGASDEVDAAAARRLVQLTSEYGRAVKRMHDHGADLASITAVVQGDVDVKIDIEEIRCVLLFAD
ncbi:hypothetical protein [Mycolicibacterium sp. 624]|uniref:hypothetical protein n=1 Tax=Mycolicibacterium sp. 624 TaxID=3156314 RepID=UPI0033987084